MFTGIIKNIGIVKQFKKKTNGYYLTVISKLQFTKKDIGTSISCSGVCLTLTKIKKYKSKNELFFYLSKHTVLTSAFKYLSSGDIINLEKSMKYGDEFAGHFVQGHVDTTIKVLSVDSSNKKSFTLANGKVAQFLINPKGYDLENPKFQEYEFLEIEW